MSTTNSAPEHNDAPSSTHANPNMAFTKAVLAFSNMKNNHKAEPEPVPAKPVTKPVGKKPAIKTASKTATKKAPKVEVVETTETEADPDPEALALKAHHERHVKRIRLARGIQHLLTGILSVVVAILQGAVYVKYLQTKDVKGAWPTTPNLLPTLMLFSTAIAGMAFDAAAVVAYALPQTPIGKKALALAKRANTMITTIKTTAYGFSSVVCRAGFNFGNSSGMNNDLWSWSCSAKGAAAQKVNNAAFNCAGSTAAWYLSLFSIAIQFIGIVIDQVNAADAKKFAGANTDTAEDSKPLLPNASKPAKNDTKDEKDDEYDELEKMSQGYDDQLNGLMNPTDKKSS